MLLSINFSHRYSNFSMLIYRKAVECFREDRTAVARGNEHAILLRSSNGSILELRSNDSSRSRILLRSTSRSIANAKKNNINTHDVLRDNTSFRIFSVSLPTLSQL